MPKDSAGGLAVQVCTLENQYDLKLKPSATARNLFDTIVSTTGLREVWYFGISYTDTNNLESWMRNEKKITKQDVKKESPLKLQFKIRFFPENVADEVIQDVTLRLMFKQVREEILTEKVYCPAEKAVLLASFAVQAKFGDYDSSKHESGYLSEEKLLAPIIITQHNLTVLEWEDKIREFHRQHKTLSPPEAMMEYLKIAQDLEQFGVTYFPVVNTKGTDVWLGIDALGINFFEKNEKLNPKSGFPWSEIAKVSYKKQYFTIRFTDRKVKPQKIRGKHPTTAKKIFYMATGNHEMYKRRRMSDPLDVQQMKAEKEAERLAREKQKAKLRKEMEARERLEKMQKETEDKFKQMEVDLEKRQKELEESRGLIAQLEEQLAETQRAREELERQQQELREMLEKLEQDREMDVQARQQLEEEIRQKQEEIDSIKVKVDEKEEESQRLRDQVDKMPAPALASAAASTLLNNDSSSSSSASSEAGGDDDEHMGVPAIVVDRPSEDEDRQPDPKTEDLLQSLRSDLSGSKVAGTETQDDATYRENLSQGRDKFKTLRDIRSGNTKRRIDTFENL